MAIVSQQEGALAKFFEDVGPRYKPFAIIGEGGFGNVVAAHQQVEEGPPSREVAIKKVSVMARIRDHTQEILREVMLLAYLEHDNLVSIYEIILKPSAKDLKCVYIVQERVDTDLFYAIQQGTLKLPADALRITYQILRGIKYLHSASVIHRDLKPENILLKLPALKVKICDLGAARVLEKDDMLVTLRQGTQCYQAPEMLIASGMYSKKVDIWSIGVILAEFFTCGCHLIPKGSPASQLRAMVELLGKPAPHDMAWIWDTVAISFVKKLPDCVRKKWRDVLLGTIDESIHDLVSKLLTFNPQQRPLVEEALEHCLFKNLRIDEPTAASELSFGKDIRQVPMNEVPNYFAEASATVELRQQNQRLQYL